MTDAVHPEPLLRVTLTDAGADRLLRAFDDADARMATYCPNRPMHGPHTQEWSEHLNLCIRAQRARNPDADAAYQYLDNGFLGVFGADTLVMGLPVHDPDHCPFHDRTPPC